MDESIQIRFITLITIRERVPFRKRQRFLLILLKPTTRSAKTHVPHNVIPIIRPPSELNLQLRLDHHNQAKPLQPAQTALTNLNLLAKQPHHHKDNIKKLFKNC